MTEGVTGGISIDQVLWGLFTLVFIVAFFFIKAWKISVEKSVDKVEINLSNKLDKDTCIERHEEVVKDCNNLYKHKHAPTGKDEKGGEVIIP